MLKIVLILLFSTHLCFSSDSDTLPEEPVHFLAQRVIDSLEGAAEILYAFDEITEVHQDLPLDGHLCHHYAITKTLGLEAVPNALKKEYDPAFLETIIGKCYRELNGANATRSGDLIVYFDSDSDISHFGIYRGNGLVESKWGSEERILLHPLLFVPSGYGTDIASYRPKSCITPKHLSALYKKMYEIPKTKKKSKKRKMLLSEERNFSPRNIKKGKQPVRVETDIERLMRVMEPTPQHRRN